ncbi:MAG: hypothetical protein KDC92_06060 [Bacteroidetes bacterium]|nr:hypothetical protein [Bacteroidota bacterium]
MRVLITFMLLAITVTSSCYKDTKTNRCAYENPIDFENECRDVDGYITFGGTSNVLAYKPIGLEQFQPSYNPHNANEIAYVLNPKTRDNIKGHVVVANLETGVHRFVSWLDDGYETSKVLWSKNGMLYVSGRGIVDPKTGDYQPVKSPFNISFVEWDAEGNKLFGWISRHFNDSSERYWKTNYPGYKMVTISWPELIVEPNPLFKDMEILPQVTSISSQNEIKFGKDGVLYYTNVDNYDKKLLFDSDVKIGGEVMTTNGQKMEMNYSLPANHMAFSKLKRAKTNNTELKKAAQIGNTIV